MLEVVELSSHIEHYRNDFYNFDMFWKKRTMVYYNAKTSTGIQIKGKSEIMKWLKKNISEEDYSQVELKLLIME